MQFKFKVKNQMGFVGVSLYQINNEGQVEDWETITMFINSKERVKEARQLAKILNKAIDKFKINEIVKLAEEATNRKKKSSRKKK